MQQDNDELASLMSPDDYAGLTDETITQDHINEMKLLGLCKPEGVSWPRWMGPRDINHRHEHIIHLAAMGHTNNQIAKEMKMNVPRISIILNTPVIKEAILKKREEYYGNDAKQIFKTLMHKAFQVLEDTLNSSTANEKTKLEAAKYALDQISGKATQSVQVTGNVLHEIISKLDQREREANQDVIDATHTEL